MHTSINILPGWDITSNIIPETEIQMQCWQVWLHSTPGACARTEVQREQSRTDLRVEVTSARKPTFGLRGNLCKNAMLSDATVQWIPGQFPPSLIAEMGKSVLVLLTFNFSHLQEKTDQLVVTLRCCNKGRMYATATISVGETMISSFLPYEEAWCFSPWLATVLFI